MVGKSSSDKRLGVGGGGGGFILIKPKMTPYYLRY